MTGDVPEIVTPAEAFPLKPAYARWLATGRFPAFLRREALHEAGHAVVATILGLPVVFVTLSARDGSEGHNPCTRIAVRRSQTPRVDDRLIVYALAGNAADGRDWRRTRDTEGGDRAGALEAAAAAIPVGTVAERDALLRHLWAVARRLTRRHRLAIDQSPPRCSARRQSRATAWHRSSRGPADDRRPGAILLTGC